MASAELAGGCPCGAVRFVVGAVFDACPPRHRQFFARRLRWCHDRRR